MMLGWNLICVNITQSDCFFWAVSLSQIWFDLPRCPISLTYKHPVRSSGLSNPTTIIRSRQGVRCFIHFTEVSSGAVTLGLKKNIKYQIKQYNQPLHCIAVQSCVVQGRDPLGDLMVYLQMANDFYIVIISPQPLSPWSSMLPSITLLCKDFPEHLFLHLHFSKKNNKI